MAQAGQPVKGNKKDKFNWTGLIIAVVLLAGLVLFALWQFGVFKKKPTIKSQTEFDTAITAAAKDDTDKHYFVEIKKDSNTNALYVTEHVAVDPKAATKTYKNIKYTVYCLHDFNEKYVNIHVTATASGGVTAAAPTTLTKALTAPKPGDSGKYLNAPIAKAKFNWLGLIISLLPMAILIGVMVWIYKKQSSGSGGIMGSGKSVAKKVISKKRFSDIAGNEEVIEEVKEVIDFLKNPKKYKAAGAKIPKGILLGGPPGTGKTLVAKATAGEAGVPFYFISASNFVEMFAGLGAKRVRTMFEEARRNAPAVLFIDELDAVARKRGSSLSGNDEREQTLNQILVEMDGMDENTGLLILAATNRPDVLDPAILRPGRFDRTITLNNPDIKEREEILILHAKGKRISEDVSFKDIAKRVPGYSGAELESIINEATLLSVREGSDVVTATQIDEAIDRVKAGPAKKNRVIDKEELKMVAYHEAGHAVIGLKVSAAFEVQKITIIPRGDAGGYNLMTPKKET
ncbi:MAG: AAA family ATPase, partial [Mycoplasmataceae bacterium]|nr:AAA family ATPase [Mycoplasmataceae bacterium]